MGMFTNETNGNSGNNNGNANGRDFEKAKGFANFYLPTATGRVKFGSIALKESDKGQKAVLDLLMSAQNEAELNERMQKILNKLQFEFNPVTNEGVDLAL